MKYRKLPVVIEAFQWNGQHQKEYPDWLWEAVKCGKVYFENTDPVTMIVKTLEGDHTAKLGDYIIQGIKGELYPCKPDIFEKTYEAVEEE